MTMPGAGQGDVAAVIVFVEDGLDVLAGSVGGGVHVAMSPARASSRSPWWRGCCRTT